MFFKVHVYFTNFVFPIQRNAYASILFIKADVNFKCVFVT